MADDLNQVMMYNPDGALGYVHADKVNSALGHNFERAIKVHDPKGQEGWVRQTKALKALDAGFYVADQGALIDPKIWPQEIAKQGRYKMTGPSGKVIPIPYAFVGSAAKAGYAMSPDDRQTYIRDAAADPNLKPGVVGRNSAGQPIFGEKPVEQTPFSSTWNALKQGVEGIGKTIDPRETPEEKERNKKSGPLGYLYDQIMYIPERLALGQIAEGQQAKQSFDEAGVPLTRIPKTRDERYNREQSLRHAVAAAIPIIGPWVEQASTQVAEQIGKGDYGGAAGTAVGNAILYEAPSHLRVPASDLLSKAVTSLPEGTRNFIRNTIGVADKAEDLIKNFGKESDKVRTKNDEITEQNKQTKLEALRKRKAEEEAHAAKTAEVRQHNDAVLLARKKRAETKQKLEAESKELDQKRVDAEKKATGETNTAFNTVRDVTAGYSTDISHLQKVTEIAADQADPATSALFKRIIKGEQPNLPTLTRATKVIRYVDQAGNPVDPMTMGAPTLEGKIQRGEVLVEHVTETLNPEDEGYDDLYESQYGEPPPIGGGPAQFNRLQRWYSYISNRMYGGGKVEGGLYHSYKMVRRAINDAMIDITNQVGNVPDPFDPNKTVTATSLLDTARKLHTRKMETFSDSPNEPATVSSKWLQETTPEYVKNKARKERLAKVAEYDPSVIPASENVENLRAGLDALQKDEPLRDQIKQNPPPLEPAPKVEQEPLTKFPDGTEVPRENLEYINRGLRRYGRAGQWVVRMIFGGGLEIATHGTASIFGGTMLFGQVAISLLTDALRKPTVLSWLAKPSAEELKMIDSLNPDDAARLRQALVTLAADELSRKVDKMPDKFDPTMARFLLGAGASQKPTLDDLKKQVQQSKPQPSAPQPMVAGPAPGPQSSVTSPITHVYDQQRGVITPV